jgi:hypothetical protein
MNRLRTHADLQFPVRDTSLITLSQKRLMKCRVTSYRTSQFAVQLQMTKVIATSNLARRDSSNTPT